MYNMFLHLQKYILGGKTILESSVIIQTVSK